MTKKLLSMLLGLILCGLTTSATADECDYSCYDPCEWTSPDGKFFASADWLYWKTEQSNMDIAEISFSESDDGISFSNAKPLHPDSKFDSGFRVTAGYALPCNGWDINISYYNIRTNNTKSAVADPDAGFLIFFRTRSFPAVPGNTFSEVDLKWSNNIHNVDLDIGRTITFGECFRLRPHVGFRATWMNQNYHYDATGDFEFYPGAFGNIVSNGKIRQKFQGYGVEGGVWGSWDIGAGFSLIGHVGGSILYTKFSVDAEAFTINNQTFGTFSETFQDTDTVSNKLFLGIPSMDYFIGFRYSSNFCDTELSAHVGWEQHIWFDVNQFAVGDGNLTTQGLTLGLAVAF